MSNHYHLLLETPEANLSAIMQHINGAYTNYFNTKRQRSGHLLQGRYKAILVERDEYALELSRYIHLNPVRAKMVERPGGHRWSSYEAYVGGAPAPEWLVTGMVLGDTSRGMERAQMQYQGFVEVALGREVPNPLDDVVGSTLLGSPGFVEWVKEKFVKGRPSDRDLPALRTLSDRPTIEAIRRVVERRFAGQAQMARGLALHLCHRLSGRGLKEIGEAFGVGPSAVSEASRRVAKQLPNRPDVAKAVEAIQRELGP